MDMEQLRAVAQQASFASLLIGFTTGFLFSFNPVALAAMASKRLVVPLIRELGYRRVLVGNTILVGLAMASFALIAPAEPAWLRVVQLAFFGLVNSLQFTSMNTITLNDLEGPLASGGNSLLSMVMMLSTSLGVAAASGLPSATVT